MRVTVPRVHLADDNGRPVCGWSLVGKFVSAETTVPLTTDRRLVTCGRCEAKLLAQLLAQREADRRAIARALAVPARMIGEVRR